MIPEIVVPRPGDVYTQLGMRLVIGQVTPAEIIYCVRDGSYTSPPCHYSLENFMREVAAGRIQKDTGKEG